MNRRVITQMMLNKNVRRNFWALHKKFSQSKEYKMKNMLRAGLNTIKNDRIVKHGEYYLVNSFLPPVNSAAFLNMAMQVPGEDEIFFTNHIIGKRLAPISTYVAVTNKCMYHCWHCSANKSITSAKQNSQSDFTTKELLTIVEELQRLGVGIIGFTGGEPLLRKDLEQIIASIQPSSTSFIFTTGFQLTYERALSLKEAGLFGIAISIDSIDSKRHDMMRGYDGAYHHGIMGIRNAKKAGLYTMSQTVCTKELMDSNEIFELAKMLKDEGIDEMRIMEPMPCGKIEADSDAVLSFGDQQKLKDIHIVLNRDKRYPKTSVFPYVESREQFGCGAGSQHSYIDAKGNFGPCDFLGINYGNVFKEDIKEIWERMHEKMGKPKCTCYAKEITNDDWDLPDFYLLLGGNKK
ncbi:MAG: radical SAM protein [Epulopiscium sp.]|nr:radical SAM protein [Candidatus Epulonipiscium sp.]